MSERATRESDTREAAQRGQAWAPPSQFPTPPPTNGVVFHWIRTAIRGEFDQRNVHMRQQEGWVPVKASEYPQFSFQADPNSRFEGNIEMGGLLLCRNSAERMAQRKLYYNTQTRRQVESVDNSMFKVQDKRVPMFSTRDSRVTVGRKSESASKE